MPTIHCNGIEIACEERGDPSSPVLLLIQGLSLSSAAWPPALIDALVERGFRLVMPDNRDIGQSQVLDELGVPNMLVQFLRWRLGLRVAAPYALDDMMQDMVALCDALDIESAHVVGVSMGGMISQLLAIQQPRRVKSLTSIMSTTGNRKLPGPDKAVARHIMRGPASSTPAGRIEFLRQLWRMLGSPDHPQSDAQLEAFIERILARGMTADGIIRQRLAIMAAPDRVARLRQIRVPTLVIHGEADPLVPVECGADTAAAIAGAGFERIAGMGHELPESLVPTLGTLIAEHALAAEMRGTAS